MPPVAITDCYADLLDHLSDYSGGDGTDRDLRDYRRAVQTAYRDLMLANEWKAYLTRGRINLNPLQDDGTIEVDVTGGTYERQVTLTGYTWPTWAIYGTLLIDGVRYKIDERKSSTVLTLTYDSCPTADISAGTTYTLYQNIYPLPEDFRRLDDLYFENGLGALQPVASVGDWLSYDQDTIETGRPYLYAIGDLHSTRKYGKMAVYVHPAPEDAESIDFVYWRNARPIYYNGYETECRVGTVTGSAGSATITGTTTTFHAKMVGSILRLSRDTTNYPSGLGGENPYQEQHVIKSVESATSLTLETTLTYSYAAVKYCITDPVDADAALLEALYRRAELALDNLRHPDRVPGRMRIYEGAFREACERDQRLEPNFGLYGRLWQFGGSTNITNIINVVEDDTPDPGGGGETVPSLLYSMASINTVANTTSETALYSDTNAEGSRTIAANTWGVADVIRVRASGTYGTADISAGTLTLRLSMGSTVLHMVSMTMPDAQSGKSWRMEAELTRHSIGPTGTVSGVGLVEFSVEGEAALQVDDDPVVNEALASDSSQTVAITAQWGTASSANTITCSSLTVEQVGA